MTQQTGIPTWSASDGTSAPELLGTAGAVVLQGMLDQEAIDQVMSELAPHLDAAEVQTDDDGEDFYPGHTRRVTGIVARSPSTHDLILHEQIKAICDELLLPNCERYQLHVGSALVVGPGARSQVLHREDDPFEFFAVPRPNMVIAFMWALCDFTVENGATLIVPGSHPWPAGRQAKPDEVVSATMQAGDVLAWMGGTLHGAGENVSASDWRHGLFCSYSLGWLRQEENQFLDMPLRQASDLDKPMREILGYKMHRGLGFYDPSLNF